MLFLMSIIFAFHPKLKMRKVIIKRSFGHSERQLISLNYLKHEQVCFKDNKMLLQLKDNKMLLQLKDCVLNGLAKNSTFAISKMFSIKLKFAAARLLAGFDKKFKNSNLELSYDGKTKYEIKNMIDSESYACCICSFPSQINLTNMIDIRNTKRFSYCDFYIMQEHNSL